MLAKRIKLGTFTFPISVKRIRETHSGACSWSEFVFQLGCLPVSEWNVEPFSHRNEQQKIFEVFDCLPFDFFSSYIIKSVLKIKSCGKKTCL